MTYMQLALSLAEHGRATCMPNPMVGCVIVRDSMVVGSGFHRKAGCAHAEVNALNQAGSLAYGADVYVTLEPCSHFGRTPPCVDALIAASVKSVHVAIEDPNPLVAGNGIRKLQEAGISVFVGEQQEHAYQLNKSFFYYISQRKPFVIAKWAMSLDGKIASDNEWGPGNWITAEPARMHAHSIRAQVGGIMVGENTVRIDDPALTVRYGMESTLDQLPRPIVLTTYGNLTHDKKIFARDRNTLVITSKKADSDFLNMLDKNNIEHCFVETDNHHLLLLPEVFERIAAYGISRVLVEGGSQLLTHCFSHQLVNEVYIYIAPTIIGGADSLSPIQGFLPDKCIFNYETQRFARVGSDAYFFAETELTSSTYEKFKKRTR